MWENKHTNTDVRAVKRSNYFWKTIWNSLRCYKKIWPGNSTMDLHPKEVTKKQKTYLYKIFKGVLFISAKKLERNCVPNNWIAEQIMTYKFNGILLCHKKITRLQRNMRIYTSSERIQSIPKRIWLINTNYINEDNLQQQQNKNKSTGQHL